MLDTIQNKQTKQQNTNQMVQWSDDLSYGVEAMDNDHKVMISLVNRMHTIAADNKDGFDVKLLLAKLAEYAILHFRREEIVMETCLYPDYESHMDYHHKLEMQVFALLKNKDKKFSRQETDDLLLFLSDWLYDHISTVDRTMTPYVANYLDQITIALKDTKAVQDL